MSKVNYIVLFFISISLKTFGQNQSPDISLVFYLDENSDAGTLVGAVNATDPDGDPLTFSITSGNTDDAFAINSSTGDITVNSSTALDFESNPTFDLTVEADDGQGGMTLASVTINLNDIDENVLGVTDNQSIQLYPNPAINFFHIELEEGNLGEYEIRLYSVSGNRIPLELIQISRSAVRLEFNQLSPGSYFVNLASENRLIRQRVLIR